MSSGISIVSIGGASCFDLFATCGEDGAHSMRAAVVLIMIGAECRPECGTRFALRRYRIKDVALRSINSKSSMILLPNEQRTGGVRQTIVFTEKSVTTT